MSKLSSTSLITDAALRARSNLPAGGSRSQMTQSGMHLVVDGRRWRVEGDDAEIGERRDRRLIVDHGVDGGSPLLLVDLMTTDQVVAEVVRGVLLHEALLPRPLRVPLHGEGAPRHEGHHA